MTVEPIAGKGQLFFTAEATEAKPVDDKPKIVTSYIHPPIPIREYDWSLTVTARKNAETMATARLSKGLSTLF